MMSAMWTHLVKDLRIEWRSLDALISMLFFSGLVVVLFLDRVRAARSLLTADCGRRSLRCNHVRVSKCAEPSMGA